LEGQSGKEISALLREGLADSTNRLPSPDNIETKSDNVVRLHNIADALKPFDKPDGTTVTPEVIVISGAQGMGKKHFVKKWPINGQRVNLLMAFV